MTRFCAVETSCDETSAAVVDLERGRFVVRANVVYSQVATHAKTGGVVPEVAAREHAVMITPVIEKAFAQAKTTRRNIDAFAVTAGPGLVTALIVGVEAARTFAAAWDKPLIPVNHIEAHAASNWLANRPIRFPALCLVVSGGHTELLLMTARDRFRCVGRTLDDAAGESFDKVAKLLDLGYPGGPAISKIAADGDPAQYILPRPMLTTKNLDFSFAGIKTAALYLVHGIPGQKNPARISVPDVAASFQQAVVDVLVAKTVRAAKQHGAKSVLLAGGVAANTELRRQLTAMVERDLPNATYHQPALEYCTDNAAMIAVRAAFAFARKKSWPWQAVKADPNWETW
ncbi:MAG: tRNA (adenosine(37)-N6)-threonylcarbamoyltransferase complex transferase subunit TsaD [Candidatus Kerfeldbacteria bacterium]|nr:tRNA (adenosine(37)-N6)-threonylcarbamoyltransferase complex transferase subunit TsaD [Candidatus Kerfeldbacteria bacterium]